MLLKCKKWAKTHARNAQQRFGGHKNIHVIQGQSGQVLPEIMSKIDKPCLFWLDAHWSGGSIAKGDLESPIMQEMQCILNHERAEEHIILIDDARCFTGNNDYPAMKEFEAFVKSIHPLWTFKIKDDIVRIYSNKFYHPA